MEISLPQIVKKASEVRSEEFTELVKEATQLLSSESGNVGRLSVLGRLIKIKPSGDAVVIGDLHGDLESLVEILRESNIVERMKRNQDSVLIFLGDYGDRGAFSAEVYHVVLSLKVHFPKQVVLMRGNHEGPKDLMASPHDLPYQLEARFGEKSNEAYTELRRLFDHLYTAVIVEERYLMVHGGPAQQALTVEDLAYADRDHPKSRVLEDLLWSDPDEGISGVAMSPRGAGKLFGKNVTVEALTRFNVHILVRGHEPCEEGFKINHSGKVLTLFSRKGPPYFNEHGAYLDVKFSDEFDSAEQLMSCVHKF